MTAFEEISVSKANLLDTIRSNMTAHVREYEEAMVGCRTEEVRLLLEVSSKALDLREALISGPVDSGDTDGEEVKAARAAWEKALHAFNFLDRPTSHAKDYEVSISMLEWSTEDIVVLDDDEFRNYVLDQWTWKDRFTASVANYKSYKGGK